MAEGSTKDHELFTCPVCLDLLKEPVTIPCGHSYCMGCIKDCWNQEDQKGVYSCPQCRQTFTPRPVLNKNNIFSALVEEMRKTTNQADSPADKHTEPGQVVCDVCTGGKSKAVKSCLECLVSYCEPHYKVHNLVNPGRKHKVIDATADLQERSCSQHGKALEIFCKTDQSCICYLCTMDEHSGHKTVSAAAERAEKQKQVVETQSKFQQRIQKREKELKELRKTVETLKSSARTTVEDCERIFTEMIQRIEGRRSEVKRLIEAQEESEVSEAEELVKQLEEEIDELKRRDAELDQLPHTEDHIHFLKRFQSVCASDEYEDLPSVAVNQTLSFEGVKASVSALKQQVEDFCKKEVIKISEEVTRIRTVSEPKTREEFQQYSCHFTLDPNTAQNNIIISEGNSKIELKQLLSSSHPDHPERFQGTYQVLCRESVSGRCYWEVEWSGGGISIAVSYKGINRTGGANASTFGRNDQSWSLEYMSQNCSFWHNNQETRLTPICSYKIGVYVDCRAGTLSFYSVSDAMTLLHRVQTTFTDTLYPGFRMIYYDTPAKIL
ncbi:tripartite motif-containing protein 16-like [Clupea harengus]|uniref:Tripartite motif-containing protein 16-like n=1 Tax=Clupea harengus TaxID=7950 RepID=A0A6P8FLE6_CLUHA|nr:tripartite motif-containing protein 16-like [Clupea harengus]